MRLLGAEPSFNPHATESIWELAEHWYLFIVEDAERAGTAIPTVFIDDLHARVADIASRGARRVIYRDADGDEIGFAGPFNQVVVQP